MLKTESTTAVGEQTKALLDGPLKHVRAAALAAVLLPLASVAVSPAMAQTCASGGSIGDFVWQDTNKDGLQDPDELGIDGAVVSLRFVVEDTSVVELVTATGPGGAYHFFNLCAGTYTVLVQIPPGRQPSPADQGADSLDSDGVSDGHGNSVTTVNLADSFTHDNDVDFGFWQSAVAQPGTGTPGYWKNHPEAWPVGAITVGGVSYTKAQAIVWLSSTGSDKTITMFSSLVPAILNVLIGNNPSCVASTIDDAHAWMTRYGPVGSGVKASSAAWKVGEPLHRAMDNYNNGMLCAPHRD